MKVNIHYSSAYKNEDGSSKDHVSIDIDLSTNSGKLRKDLDNALRDIQHVVKQRSL